MRAPRSLPLAAVALCVCCFAARVVEVRERVLGGPASAVRACLGAPTHASVDAAGLESWTYLLPLPAHTTDVTVRIPSGRHIPPVPPRVVGGEAVHDDETAKGSRRPSLERELIPRGTCLLFFEVEHGRVAQFDAAGRDRESLNSDSSCALLMRACEGLAP